MKITKIVSMLITCFATHPSCGLAAAEPASEQLPEVEFTDLNWNFPAYCTVAARRDAKGMMEYLEGVCLTYDLDEDAWFCGSGTPFFYSRIAGWGKPSRSGYVCKYELGLPGQRYFGDSRFEDFECMCLWWDEGDGKYEMQLPGDDAA